MTSRFFCSETPRVGTRFVLPEAVAHHALRVLRLRAGDDMVLFTGEGGEYRARLIEAGREAVVEVLAFDERECESPLELTLVQALPAGDKMDWVTQKAVELGVTRIVPVQAERSVVRLAGERAAKRVAHLQSIVIGACEQCGRNRVPVVEPIVSLAQFLAEPAPAEQLRLVMLPGGAQVGLGAAPSAIALMVGPEGGFSESEQAAIRACGWQPFTLGPRVLRTETAGLAGLATLQAVFGDSGLKSIS